MSTDHQKYSTINQAQAIAAYAARHNLLVVRTYADEGRSGLSLEGRHALKQLINDVRSGNADFDVILVYDVSRWGRFQDADESAYYEYICKETGISVRYCAEPFENDGSLTSTILKNIKRAMAAEFSRELSTKVFIGQSRVASLGFWPCSRPSYGLRRLLIGEDLAPKALLEHGQRKALQCNRTILTPGPLLEVDVVKEIFDSFVLRGKRSTHIAAELNQRQIHTSLGNRWTKEMIIRLLRNENYIGNNVYNRASTKLGHKQIINPPNMWIRREGAFEAIVTPQLFAKAQHILAERRRKLSNQEVLDRLSALWRRKGKLTQAIINAQKTSPSVPMLVRRFGSVAAAYKLIGFQPKSRYDFVASRAKMFGIIRSVASDIVAVVRELGGHITFDADSNRLTAANETPISFLIARQIDDRPGQLRWYVSKVFQRTDTDYALMIRVDAGGAKIRDYCLLPTEDLFLLLKQDRKIGQSNRAFANRYDNLDVIYQICMSAKISPASVNA